MTGQAEVPAAEARGRLAAQTLPLLLAAVIGTGALLTAALAVRSLTDQVQPWALLLGAVLCLIADRPLLDIRFGHNSESFTWAELCVVLGVYVLPLPTLTVTAGVAVLLFHLLMRRAPVKAAFNAASFVIGVVLASAVAMAFHSGGGGRGFDGAQAVGLLLGAAAFFLWNSTVVAWVVSLSAGQPFRAVYRKGLLLRSLVGTGNIAAALIVLLLWHWSRPSVLVLPPLLLLLYTAYRGYLHAMQERDVWQQLERSARELNQLDEAAVAGAAVVRTAQLLKADVVEVTVDAGGAARSYLGTERGLVDSTGATLGDGGQVLLYGAPLEGPTGRIGLLRVGFHGHVTLSRREQQVLKTFAHAVSTTLQNAMLYEEMRLHAEAKAYQAEHDELTGLGNRALLHRRADAALTAACEQGRPCALLLVDLDHFKEINDTLGHAAGDVFLCQVGARLRRAVPDAAAVCRLGGDEFAVLLSGLARPEDADAVARRLLEVLAEPVVSDGLRLSIEGSIGVACAPQDATTFDALLQRADVAMYQAKGSRGSIAHYSADTDGSSVQRLALAAELRTALARDELTVHFQPQYDLRGDEVAGVEALVRWEHPQRGLLPPADFIDAVEHSGLVRDFTMTVLDKAVAECSRWQALGRALPIAVNLSARNLLDRSLPADVAAVLARYGLAPHRLVLEITETTMMSELDVVEVVLGQLRALGVQLSVDDFGTGYSSLAFLQRVRVNEVKIDRRFVAGLDASDSDAALVRATVQLAHSLGARCVGEGVETVEQYRALQALGCDLAQGYHLCRPVPAALLVDRLALGDPVVAVPAPRRGADAERHLRAVVR